MPVMRAFLRRVDVYPGGRDDLAADRTSHLSPYLRFGCLSPLELAGAGLPEDFVRQLCWRDFFHQLTAAHPRLTRDPLRTVERYATSLNRGGLLLVSMCTAGRGSATILWRLKRTYATVDEIRVVHAGRKVSWVCAALRPKENDGRA